MSIKRKTTQYDVEHGGTFNKTFVPKGIDYYEDNGETNAEDKHVNSADLTFTDSDHLEEGEEYPHLDVNGDENITHDTDIGHNLTVHNDTTVEGNTHLVGKPEGEDGDLENEPALTVDNNTLLKGQTEEDEEGNVSYVGNALEVEGKSKFDEDVQMDKKLHVDGETTIDDDFYVNGTATITGDLYVKGTSFEEHAVDLNVGADFVRVREGATAGLDEGEKSGIIINNYDGEDSLGIVSDAHGTLRIGEFNTVKVYTTDDTTYYSDRELTTEIEIPEGKKLYQIGETDPETGLKEYYFIAKDETEPVATRGNTEDMENEYLTKWNEEGEDIITSNITDRRATATEVRSKDVDERVRQIQEGDINLNTTNQYPVVIEKTESPEYLQIDHDPIGKELTRVSQDQYGNTYYESDRPLYTDDTGETEWQGFRSHDDNGTTVLELYDGENWVSGDLYYEKRSNSYDFSLTNDNVIRYFDSVQDFLDEKAATEEGTSDNPLKPENVILIRNCYGTTGDIDTDLDLGISSPLTITDTISAGNYNAITSNAVSRLTINMGAALVDDVTIKLTPAVYGEITDTFENLLAEFFDSTGDPRKEAIYVHTDDGYEAISHAELDETSGKVVFTYLNGTAEGEPLTRTTVYHVSGGNKMYAVIDNELKSGSNLPIENRIVTSHLNTIEGKIKNTVTFADQMLPESEIDAKISAASTTIGGDITALETKIDDTKDELNQTILDTIDGLDVSQIGGSNTYIKNIKEVNGKIEAESATFPTQPTFTLSGTTLYITR